MQFGTSYSMLNNWGCNWLVGDEFEGRQAKGLSRGMKGVTEAWLGSD